MKFKTLLLLLSLLLLPLAVFAEAAANVAAVPVDTTPFWIKLVAAVTAVVLAARAIVKLTPTPKDDSVVEKVVDFLKHIGLHIGCLCLLCCLLFASGCGTSHPTSVAVNTDNNQNITGAVTTEINDHVTAGVQGSGNPNTGDWTAGVVVTFKDWPAETTIWALQAADAVPTKGTHGHEWMLPKVDWSNTEVRNALMAALKNGATITALKP